jgi:hypothetical protein
VRQANQRLATLSAPPLVVAVQLEKAARRLEGMRFTHIFAMNVNLAWTAPTAAALPARAGFRVPVGTSIDAVACGMPTVLHVDGYRFFFFSREGQEPAHIHVEQAERFAKFWLTPVALARTHGFRSSELTELTRLVIAHRAFFEEKWNEHLRHQG